jgi:hypothetical protein
MLKEHFVEVAELLDEVWVGFKLRGVHLGEFIILAVANDQLNLL